MTPEEKATRTKRLAELLREKLPEKDFEANVRCHHYLSTRSMVTVHPKPAAYKALSYWEQVFFKSGLENYLNLWVSNGSLLGEEGKILLEAAKIYVE